MVILKFEAYSFGPAVWSIVPYCSYVTEVFWKCSWHEFHKERQNRMDSVANARCNSPALIFV